MQLLADLQRDILGRLESCPEFHHVCLQVLSTNGEKGTASVRDQIENALTGITLTNGKCGLGAVIVIPEVVVEDNMRGVPGPQIALNCTVQVMENDLFNRGDQGTGITAESLAFTVLSLLHLWQPGGGIMLLAAREAIQPAEAAEDLSATNCYAVNLTAPMATQPAAKVNAPSLDVAAGVLTLSGVIGAEHWFTLDGTFPRPMAPTAQLYTATVSVPSGALIRAASYQTDAAGSDVTEFQVP